MASTESLQPTRADHLPPESGTTTPNGIDWSSGSSDEKRRRRDDWIAIANFHPGWFAANMGTGITAILLENLPYQFNGLHYIAVVIFVLNVALFTLFLTVSIVRYTLWPEKFLQTLTHPAHSMLWGTFPMGFATIVNLVVFICVPAWGSWAATMAWVMWWIDTVVSIATCLYIPFLLTTEHQAKLETMTAAWLLPIVAPIVAAASGGVVADVLPNPRHAIITITVSYVMWGTAVPFAMLIFAIYFQRLALHKLVPRAAIVSTLLPVGPLGQGGFGIMQLGVVARKAFSQLDILSPIGGEIFYVGGILIALIMWGFGLLWLWFACASFSKGKFPFNLGWWAFTFPLGVFTTSTTQLGKELGFKFFDVLGTILSVVVTLLWLMVFSLTVWKTITREVFKM
ncbi:hypothetical protein VTO42DRAFT_482 [Malbranchea cinnamomea]